MHSVLRYVDWTLVALAVLAALLTLLLLEIFSLNSTRNKFPPGPRPLPFIGNMHQMLNEPMTNIRALTRYGDLCTIFLGRKPSVVLNNLEMVKEAFVQNGAGTSGRPFMPLMKWVTKGYGIVMANGYVWKQQRRFALHTLRDFGLGKKTVEERVTEESRFLVKEMLKHEGKPFYPIHPIMNAVSNIICSIVFGDRFDYDDERFAKLLKILNENIHLAGSAVGRLFNLLPVIRFLPGSHHKILENTVAQQRFIRQGIKEHQKTLDPQNLRDFIDAYLFEISKGATVQNVLGKKHLTHTKVKRGKLIYEDNLIKSTSDLFSAETDTTANTLRWGLIYMMQYPQIQERCHEEIVSALGHDRTPTMHDRVKLPYTYATIHEIQRCANIVPLGVLHQSTEPTSLGGYQFPKGTQFMPNLTAILSDKRHWKHPDTFNPENFLDEKGQFCKQESFLPFSLGPRVCLGEALARMELFIFFISLIQHLHFSWPPKAPPPNMEGVVGFVRSPAPFHMVCRSRATSH